MSDSIRNPQSEIRNPPSVMHAVDVQLSHVWMVRAFLKHCEEAEEDDELQQVHRELYDYMLTVGEAWKQQDAAAYLKQANKKYAKLQAASDWFAQIQPEISSHTNFQMAVQSLTAAVVEIGRLLELNKKANVASS